MTRNLSSGQDLLLFGGFGLFTLLSVFAAVWTDSMFLIGLPIGILFVWQLIADYKMIFWLLILALPLSTEIDLPGGLATDLPSEPVMVILMVAYLFLILTRPERINHKLIRHPLIILLFLHVIWIAVTVLYSQTMLISFKFLLAKLWYVTVFTFMGFMVLKEMKDIRRMVWLIAVPLAAVVLQAIIRHAMVGFSFDLVNQTLTPFFRNHVSYACMISIMIPFVFYSRGAYNKGSFNRFALNSIIVILLAGLVFSYTRGAWLGLIIGAIAVAGVYSKTFKLMILAAITFIGMGLGYMIKDNNYLEYSTDFHKTIYHEDLLDHLKATMKRLDVSSAERVYRWIAGFHMSDEKMIMGYGPGSFHSLYKSYTVNLFTTWVSDNQEKSGIHNYFLMTLVEQGLVGLILFSLLAFGILFYGERIWHRSNAPPEKAIILAIIVSTIIIYVQIMLSDLIEVDKVGSFFFINLALIVRQDLKNKKEVKELIELKQ